MDIPTLLFALVNCAIVVYLFDRLGSMIPDSSWGGLYVVAERMWSWREAIRSPAEPAAPLGRVGSSPSDDTPVADSWDEPVPVIEEISGSRTRWPW
jgi:hypothetical protein